MDLGVTTPVSDGSRPPRGLALLVFPRLGDVERDEPAAPVLRDGLTLGSSRRFRSTRPSRRGERDCARRTTFAARAEDDEKEWLGAAALLVVGEKGVEGGDIPLIDRDGVDFTREVFTGAGGATKRATS